MKNIKAVFIFRDMGAGGAQKIEAYVANLLSKEGCQIIAINMGSTNVSIDLNNNIEIINLNYDNILNSSNKILISIQKFTYLIKLRQLIHNISPDIVCSFLSDVVRLTVLALKGLEIPIIGSERGDPFSFTKKQFKRYRKAYSCCATVVFQLPNVKEIYQLPPKINQVIIPNPCSPRLKTFYRQEKDNSRIIVGAGRLTQQKRFDVLIKAFSKVYNKYPEYKLIIYGDGPLKEKLLRCAQEASVDKSVYFPGNVDDVFKEAKNAEIFVLSSDYEGIPNVLLEAMATGIPCVSTDCSPGGASYLLEDGKVGLISPCGDHVKLADSIIRYIEHPEERYRMKEEGLKAIKKYNPEIIKKQWIEVFMKIIKE